MRGLLNIGLTTLLVPVLAVPFVPDDQVDQEWGRRGVKPFTDRLFAHIDVQLPPKSPDADLTTLGFRLEVLESETACGYGNVTIDGTVLPQTLDGDVWTGKGSVSTTTKSIVVGSWAFHCVKVSGVPDAQFMKFAINFVDGKAVENAGFSVLFRQSGMTEIVKIVTDLSIPDEVVANPNPENLQPAGDSYPHHDGDMDEDLAELDYLWSQLREIKYLIHQKERAIAHRGPRQHEADIKDCDSLKCVVKAMAHQANHAAHKVYGKISGDDEDFKEFKHHPKGPFGKHRSPKDGNHTHHEPHGNHTQPPPWKRPHGKPLPICRYPPPPPHRSPFHHGPPPHHPPPHHDGGPDMPPPEFDSPPPHDFPPPPPEFEDPHGHHGPGHHEGPEFDEPPRHGPEGDRPPPPPPFHGPPPHHRPGKGPEDHPHPPPPDFDGPPPPHHEGHPPQDGEHGGPPPPEDFFKHDLFDGPPPHRGPPHNGVGRALQIIKFTTIGFLAAFLIAALHRRVCTPSRRADRQARREERHRRRAYRRAAHKHAITRLLARMSGNDSDEESDDCEEKGCSLLSDAEDGLSTTMTEDISQLRNAAEVVGEMVSAESEDTRSQAPSEPISIPVSETRPLMQDFELGSQIGDGEELPAYEDNDGSEEGSVVADGFRYMPGSQYTPSQSESGSVSDILGPDTKS